MKWFLGLYFVVMSFVSVAQNKVILTENPYVLPSIEEQKKANEKALEETLAKLKVETDKQLPGLLKNFDLKKVDGTESGWYRHKQINRTGSFAEAPVSLKGHMYFKAHFKGAEPTNATRIRVKIGEHFGAWESKPLNKDSKYITRLKEEDKWNETLNFFSYKNGENRELRSIEMIRAIALAKDNEKVVLIFIGPTDNIEVALTKENISAIRESWLMSQYICYKQNKFESFTQRDYQRDKGSYTMLMPAAQLSSDDMKGTNIK
jgi:hypothetical protein